MMSALRRRTFLSVATVAALLGPTLPSLAQAGGAFTPVETLDNGLMAIMKAGRAVPFEQRMGMLLPIVQQVFDLPEVLRTVVGVRYASFTPAQQQQLLQAFTQFTAASYTANFDTYDGQRFTVSPTTRPSGNDVVVSTTFTSGSDTTRFDYVVRPTSSGYRIVDVLLDGSISRVAVQRSDFRSVLTSNDPSALISMLQSKVNSLAAGSSG